MKNVASYPLAWGIVGIALALSMVVGIVVQFVSTQNGAIEAQAASQIASYRQNAGIQSNVGAAFAALPTFAVKEVSAEPNALIWWDETDEPTATPQPTRTPEPTSTPIPTPPTPPTMAPVNRSTYQTAVIDGWAHVLVPGGALPCHHLARFWNNDVLAIGPSPFAGWFNGLPLTERQLIIGHCGG